VVTRDLVYAEARELARRIRGREVSPVEVAAAHLARIEELNPALNAIVTLAPGVEEEAREAEAALLRGGELGPLHGVPFTAKDSLDTAGLRTTRGSLLFAGHVPGRDAEAVARLRAAGAILLGKTNLPEFALWWETDNRVFGRTVNPWDPERTAGGSSGGEAAAIAAGLSPLGLGSDLGGSIRLPAAHCGIVGLKPTHGRVPLTGHWPETILRFMHVGPMARTVGDAALALSVIAGPDPLDWWSVPAPPPPADVERGVAGLRIGVLARAGFGAVDDEVADAVAGAAAALAREGALTEELDAARLEDFDANVLTMTLYGAEGSALFGPLVAGREDELHPRLRARLAAPRPPLDDYVAAEAEVEALRADVARLFTRIDALLCPTTPAPAHAHDAQEFVLAGRTFPARAVMRATIPWDLTGSPALSVPCGLGAGGLPLGVQVVGRRFDDATVLRVGAALERLRRPAELRPPLPAAV
jgi:aspartyl-tRNA(Asn)/glutamyl-tRNA(Gln) amidotransferase subunit A